MANVEIQEPIRSVYKDGAIVVSNVKSKIDNSITSYSVVSTWYDGSAMDDSKVDQWGVYSKFKATGEYLRENISDWGLVFLEVDTVEDLRSLDERNQFLIQCGRYKGVRLGGYYIKGDTPASIDYFISNTTDIDDNGSIFQLGDIKLEHVFTKVVNVAYYGVGLKADEDCTTVLNSIFIKYSGFTIEFVNKNTILIDATKLGIVGLDIQNNITIIGNGATLKAIPNSSPNSAVMSIWKRENVTINNLNVIGERFDHIGTDGQWGMGFDVRGSHNVKINDCSGNECWGDGLYLGVVDNLYCKNVKVSNFKGYTNRRQGISIVSVDGLDINSAILENTYGQAPSAGIDIEPNDQNAVLRGITINNVVTRGNTIGINTTFSLMQGSINEVDIKINNHYSEGDAVSYSAYSWNAAGLTGSVEYNTPTSIKAKTRAIEIRNYSINAPAIKINSPSIFNCNANGNTSAKYGAAIAIYRESGDPVYADMGNITIDSPTIIDDREITLITTPIFIRDEADITRSVAVTVRNPRKIQGYTANSPVAIDIRGLFEDIFNTAVLDIVNSTRTHNKFNFFKRYHNQSSTSNRTITLDVKEGSPQVEFEVRSAFELRIDIQPTELIEGWGGLGVPLMSKTVGSKITLRKKSSTVWEVVSFVGTWVVLEASPVTGGGIVRNDGLSLNPVNATVRGERKQGAISNTQNATGSVNFPSSSGTSWFFDSGTPGKDFSLFVARADLGGGLYLRLYAIDGIPTSFYRVITSNVLATTSSAGAVKQALASADSAPNPSETYVQLEIQALLDELRDMKNKLRSAGIISII